MKKILFTDLDGTLIVIKSGETFPKDTHDWKFKDGIIQAIQNYKPDLVYIVTNQGGIELGYVDELEFNIKLSDIEYHFATSTFIPISHDYCASNNPRDPLRKPNTGLLVPMFATMSDYSNVEYLMIGDVSGRPGSFSGSDRQCADNAKVPYMDVEDFIKTYSVCSKQS